MAESRGRTTLDLTPRRPPAGERRLPIRKRDRRRQAGAADQLVLPQPWRGHLRGVPAADGGHRLQELPDDLARRGRQRQDQVPLPVRRPLARLLLGVSGGIAVYKALELVRLA